ncbi:biotin--[acetyl-CoA-carboxylase] ligase [Flaviaesturariibacter amylovorans]|uniref:Biotin--[acetyl-CoA-carboxylase] ligase n=1 Tax=Flaviaesturariibacter amylovorans TaxID=1084520 RepID=A0ABP8GAI2_9BACT
MPPPPKRLGAPWIELQQVDSTNNYATALVHAGRGAPGTAVFAREQTNGKGQRGKSWWADPGANITGSLILAPPALSLPRSFPFSMALALGAQRFFAAYAGTETSVKWPNDLYWRDRKAGGILVENILAGADWRCAVAGFGININQTDFGEAAGRAVSLKQITGKDWEVPALARELAGWVEAALDELGQDPQATVDAYHAVLFQRGEVVRLRKGGRVFAATVLGVTESGELRVRHAVEECFGVGEVEWVFTDRPSLRGGA